MRGHEPVRIKDGEADPGRSGSAADRWGVVRADTKAINVTECGSPFFPVDPTGKSRDSEASYECVSALESRYMLL
jgi:hypothetical protein